MVCIKYLSSKTPMCKISSSIEFKIYACIGRLLSQNTKKFPLLSEVFLGGGAVSQFRAINFYKVGKQHILCLSMLFWEDKRNCVAIVSIAKNHHLLRRTHRDGFSSGTKKHKHTFQSPVLGFVRSL